MEVGTQTLRYVIAVADELSFSRAAERLMTSQPVISRQIRQLENELRTPLFTRTSRSVALTPAGEAFVSRARDVLAHWEGTQRAARQAAAARAETLRVGFEATGAGRLTTRSRTVFAERHPGVTVEPKRFDWGGEVPALREGLVDVAFIWLPADLRGLQTEVVAQEPRVVGMSVDHRLADRGSVLVADLAGEPMPWARQAGREWVEWWGVVPRPDGSEPVWGPANDNVEELLEHVATGPYVCLSAQSMASYYQRPDLAWLPVTDAEPLRIALGWPEEAANPLVDAFVDVVRELAAQEA
jgi:DNA-binding transcriptional LysR family regulator